MMEIEQVEPFGAMEVERIFSGHNLVKSDRRTHMVRLQHSELLGSPWI